MKRRWFPVHVSLDAACSLTCSHWTKEREDGCAGVVASFVSDLNNIASLKLHAPALNRTETLRHTEQFELPFELGRGIFH
jgi:hypothetical protein